MPERAAWLPQAALVVGAVTVLRIVALGFDRTDLFVDESQYWLWGQRLDFGYYSKPPLIAWVIRAVTELAGSDAPFWVRLPGSLFHGATALILAALAARLFSARAAVFVALAYATLPMTTLGSILISTDTIMAPFFAGALYFFFRAAGEAQFRNAALAGLCLGLAFLAKYAAAYFLIGGALAHLLAPSARLTLRNWIAMLAVFALVILPNVAWNIANDLTTVEHTMDNVGWVRGAAWMSGLNPAGLAEFFFSQFAVFGPVMFAALLWFWVRPGRAKPLVWFSVPPLAIVCVQALMSKAYANWAVAAYFAGTLIVVPLLLQRAPRLLALSLVINGTIAALLPVLTVTAPAPEVNGRPLLARYLGRADLSRQILAEAEATGATAIVAEGRDLLADLFHTGRGAPVAFYALPPKGRPRSYYEQNFPLPEAAGGVLYVAARAPVCNGQEVAPSRLLDTGGGAYDGRHIAIYPVPGNCILDAD
ncbi:hypothetical protein DEA8626_04130 [Defluviimonas aquaemixtae]|uniref:Glycosyltransferase RgtA/B/C/D-like domain-containing protein n=1 Tax=Albidovulum aquaemixtae TaxID=1542388 RepID=A0A2R8BNZ6_9RHOB|nr:glycosyltransferase family 39 protein [Defluviimonas aquaemixtae]SPH25094.1 hypothetical protein DEA8626_04130 [Defluviimonas aquaemixtae]